jgi:predicted nucleic acid-binding protein
MTTAVDSSVLLDVLAGDPHFEEASARALSQALAAGDVVICDAVVAEVQTMLDTRDTAMESLALMGIRYLATTEAAAVRAGHMQRRYRDRGGRRQRVVADFLIGAHAMMQCNALITRDDGFYRDYFKGLKVIVPKAS